jgi:hypothetical protein
MMSLAGASRAVVPVPADCPAALFSDPATPTPAAGAAAADGTASACAADEAAVLAELPEHPASSVPPASMAPPTARPAAAANRVRRVRSDRRFKLRVLNMPL